MTEAPTNTPIPTETPTTAPTEAPIPVGQPVNRYATINGNRVAFRSEPSTSKSNTVIKRLANGSNVYVVNEMLNDKGERWSVVMVDGQSGYIMSEYLNIMTQAESDAYAASTGATPVPTATPIPTETPTAIPDRNSNGSADGNPRLPRHRTRTSSSSIWTATAARWRTRSR